MIGIRANGGLVGYPSAARCDSGRYCPPARRSRSADSADQPFAGALGQLHQGRARRKALNRRGDRDPIRTVRSSGYALDETYTG